MRQIQKSEEMAGPSLDWGFTEKVSQSRAVAAAGYFEQFSGAVGYRLWLLLSGTWPFVGLEEGSVFGVFGVWEEMVGDGV